MKKTLALAFAFGVASAFAQDLTSKKGEPILPEAGDWAVGIDAAPLLNFAGNLMNGNTSNSAPTWNFLSSNYTIVGKMFKDEKTAYRAILRLGSQSWTDIQMTTQPTTSTTNYPNLPAMVEDKAKASQTFIGLGGGIEMRRGKTRLQGYYGGEAMFWMSSSKRKYTYGNALSTSTSLPVNVSDSHDWAADPTFGGNITTDAYGNAARVTEWKSGSTIGFGVRGFIGAEYFFLPKISVAGEFGWGIGITTGAQSSTTTESIGNTGSGTTVGTITEEGGKSGGSFRIDTDQNMFGTGTGTLRLNLHF
jgi:hypothetical protein